MKVLIALICLTTSFAFAQPKTPEQVGKVVFQMLKNLDENGFESYLTHHINRDILQELAADTAVADYVRDDFLQVTEEEIREGYREMHRELLLMESEIVEFHWKDIKFKDFIWKDEEGDGLKGISGELVFTEHDNEYTIMLAALYRNEIYRLFFVEFPYEADAIDVMDSEISEEELEQLIQELEAMEEYEEIGLEESEALPPPPPPMETFTTTGTFRSVAGVMDPLSCHCSNGGYLLSEIGIEYPICLEDGAEVDCEIITVTGHMESNSVLFEADDPCQSGTLYVMYPDSVRCAD